VEPRLARRSAMIRTARRLTRVLAWITVGYVFAGFACVPPGGITEVAAENIVRTFNLITSQIVSLLFLNFQPYAFGTFF